jgi:hypothetical protein
LAGDLLSEGRDQALAIDGDAKGGVDAVQQGGDVERGPGLLEYVIGHVNLRQTSATGRPRCRCVSLAEPADGAQLGLQRGFKYGQEGILEIVVHGGLLSMG